MKIVIYQTSDLHGYIYPTNYVKNQPLGFLKIASYILNDEKLDFLCSTWLFVGSADCGTGRYYWTRWDKIRENFDWYDKFSCFVG